MIGGFRRVELLALEWTDIDFEECTVEISKSISFFDKGEAVVDIPKTKDSVRVVVMPMWYMRELKKYYHEWRINRLKLGDRWVGGERKYLFHNGEGKPFHTHTPSHTWRKITDKRRLRHIRLRDLRHTAATILIEEKAELKTIQERLGHSKYQTTADIYAHVTKKVNKETIAKLDKFDPERFSPQSVPKQ